MEVKVYQVVASSIYKTRKRLLKLSYSSKTSCSSRSNLRFRTRSRPNSTTAPCPMTQNLAATSPWTNWSSWWRTRRSLNSSRSRSRFSRNSSSRSRIVTTPSASSPSRNLTWKISMNWRRTPSTSSRIRLKRTRGVKTTNRQIRRSPWPSATQSRTWTVTRVRRS